MTSAGTITIEVPGMPKHLPPIELLFSPDKEEYDIVSFAEPGRSRFDRAETLIRVSATGGANVPAFGGEISSAASVTFYEPLDAALVLPFDAFNGPPGNGEADGLLIRWSENDNELVHANLELGDERLTCVFSSATTTEGLIPGPLIRKMIASGGNPAAKAAGTEPLLFLSSSRSSKTVTGTYDITIIHAVGTMRSLRVSSD